MYVIFTFTALMSLSQIYVNPAAAVNTPFGPSEADTTDINPAPPALRTLTPFLSRSTTLIVPERLDGFSSVTILVLLDFVSIRELLSAA